jgi:hypothetical protein
MTLWEIGYTDIMDKLFRPSIDFGGVRDGRRTQILCYDIDLTTARDSSAGTGLILNIAGNSFYADADPSGGNCLIQFQDTSSDRALLPLYVNAGAIFNVPFTQVLIENSAQSGKKLRVFYGVDIDFQPGSVSQIAINLSGGYSAIRNEISSGNYNNAGAVTANTAVQVVAPASNINGLVVLSGEISTYSGAATGLQAFLAKSSAPSSITDGEMVLLSKLVYNSPVAGNFGQLSQPITLAAGLGLYFIGDQSIGVSFGNSRAVRYKVL